MGAPLHRLPGAPGSRRALTHASLVLVSCPDDYLLELERCEREAAWHAANEGGEQITLSVAPPPAVLLREIASPSLFAPRRLVVVRDAGNYLANEEKHRHEAEELARALDSFSFSDVTVLVTAVCAAAPKGPFVDLVARRGEALFIELPPPPKPWDKVAVSPEQREVLEGLLRRVAPELRERRDVMAALCEVHGFEPRLLAQAAKRLVLAGDLSVGAVHAQAGLGEHSLKEIEEAMLARSGQKAARFLATLAAGGELRGWWGNTVGSDGIGRVLGIALGRILRQALAIRAHSRNAGLGEELNPRSCSRDRWYNTTFRPRIQPRLEGEIASHPASPLAKMSAWQLHLSFKLAAGYEDAALLRCLARLGQHDVELAKGAEAVAAVSSAVMELITASGARAGRTARGG